MILRWQLAVYWYAIIILTAFLILLMTPNELNISANNGKSSEKQMQSLADENLKAKTQAEKAAINREINREKNPKSSKAGNHAVNMIPLKVLLILVMAIFTYLCFAHIWRKQFARQLRKKSV